MTTCTQPATGAQVSHYYVVETTCGETPANPAWRPIRFTGGTPTVTRDTLQSAELDGSREIADVRLGSRQTGGDISVELSYSAYTDLLESAMGSLLSAGSVSGSVSVTVTPGTSKFQRATGSYTVTAGDIVKHSGLAGDNNNIFVVASVSTTVNANDTITVVVPPDVTLTSETANTTITNPDKIVIGGDRQSVSILTHYADADGGAGIYQLTKGVEITGFSFDISVNALVTGTLSTIGRQSDFGVAEPSGSTYPSVTAYDVYTSLQGVISEDNAILGHVTSATITQDNAASAQFEIGSPDVAFIEKGRATNTLSLSTFFTDDALLQKFLDETETSVTLALMNQPYTRATSFKMGRVVLTSGSPEVAGEGSIIQNFEATAMKGSSGESSLEIQFID